MRTERRGALIGELSLLGQGRRSASVRAARDSELLRIEAAEFGRLMADHAAAVVLVRELASRLRQSTGLEQGPVPPEVVALVAMADIDEAARIGELFFDQLERVSATIRVRADNVSEAEVGVLVQRAEKAGLRVLLEVNLANATSAGVCIRHADQIIAVVDGAFPPATISALSGCDLLIIGRRGLERELDWIEAVGPRVCHVVATDEGLERWVERTARRLCGRSVGVVLSGGGARGFAHIGVLAELEHVGISIDRVGGCSMGAFVGALYAAGLSPAEIRAVCEREFVHANPLNDYTVPSVSVVRGRKARRMLERSFGERRVERLDRDYFCVSCDLLGAALVTHRHGALVDCVGASMNLPGILPPIARAGRMLVDGGVLDNLPVAAMAERAEGPVIGVDVTARFGAPASEARSRWMFRYRSRASGKGPPLPGVKETLARAIGIGSVAAVSEARRTADLLIAPDTGSVEMLEFEAIDRMVDAGRDAARRALEHGPALGSMSS